MTKTMFFCHFCLTNATINLSTCQNVSKMTIFEKKQQKMWKIAKNDPFHFRKSTGPNKGVKNVDKSTINTIFDKNSFQIDDLKFLSTKWQNFDPFLTHFWPLFWPFFEGPFLSLFSKGLSLDTSIWKDCQKQVPKMTKKWSFLGPIIRQLLCDKYRPL